MVNPSIPIRLLQQAVRGVIVGFCLASSFSYAALDNKGTEFFIPFLPNAGGIAAVLQLHLTAETATNVTVNYPANSPSFSTTVAITPGDITVVDIPLTADDWTSNSVANNSVRADSAEEFVAYSVNLYPQSSDAALALPVDTMNKSYVVASYPSTFAGAGFRSEFIVYAAYDNTDVTITPAVAAQGHAANVPFTINMNRGEAYFLDAPSDGPTGDLSGTTIEANRPVGLINGNGCTQVPNGTPACDHIFEFGQATQTWGKSILVSNLPNRPSGSLYRVFASEDNTGISLDGAPYTTLNRGQFQETAALPGNHMFVGDKPIFVVQYMTGQNYPGAISGDPAMGNMIPSAQFLKDYTFSTVGASQFNSQYLTIIAANSDLGNVLLDGSPIAAGAFTPIGSSGYATMTTQLSQGVHTTSSPNGHGITVEGYNSYDSFIYPGGAQFAFINPKGDPFDPVCNVTANGSNAYSGIATDNKPSEDANNNGVLDPGEDANDNGVIDGDTGVFFVEALNPVNTTLQVDAFTPGDPMATFSLFQTDTSQPGSATLRATDGAGNTCTTDITFGAAEALPCDLDSDNDVDRNDISIIQAARNTQATVDDPRDLDSDGTITLNDARMCVVQCTRSRCATE